MQKEDIHNILKNKLAPVYQARFDLVNQADDRYFKSATGEAELLNMALVSLYVKKLSSDDELKRIHDDYFSTMFFHDNQESLLAPLRRSSWNIDFNQQNFHRLVHHFAEDAGVDGFYNALNELPSFKAPITRFGEVKNWEEMKHSQVLSAPISAYYFNGNDYPVQHITQEQVDSFCAKRLSEKFAEKQAVLHAMINRLQRY